MTTISINLDNFKRFSKRLQKEQKKLGFEQTLSQSQEMLARTLGFSNYFEFSKKFNETEGKVSTNLYQEYLLKLKDILNRDESEISKCFFNYDEHQKKIYMQLESKSGYAIGLNFDQLTKNLFKITKKHFDYEDVNLIQKLNDEYFDKKINGKFWILDEIPFYDVNNDIHYSATEVPFLNNALYREAKQIFKTINNAVILKFDLNDAEEKINDKYYRTYYAEIDSNGNFIEKPEKRSCFTRGTMLSFKECHYDTKFKKFYINMFDKTDIIETDNIY